jgi:hypothetical protein
MSSFVRWSAYGAACALLFSLSACNPAPTASAPPAASPVAEEHTPTLAGGPPPAAVPAAPRQARTQAPAVQAVASTEPSPAVQEWMRTHQWSPRSEGLITRASSGGVITVTMKPIPNPVEAKSAPVLLARKDAGKKASTTQLASAAKPVAPASKPAPAVALAKAAPAPKPEARPTVLAAVKPAPAAKPAEMKLAQAAPAKPAVAAKPVDIKLAQAAAPAKPATPAAAAKPAEVKLAQAAPAPKPIVQAAAPAPVKPELSEQDRLGLLSAAMATEMRGASLKVADADDAGGRTARLSLPPGLADKIRSEAGKLGLGDEAKHITVAVRLAGVGHEVSPLGAQSAKLEPGQGADFAWKLKSDEAAGAPVTVDVTGALEGKGGAKAFPLGALMAETAATGPTAAKPGVEAATKPETSSIGKAGLSNVAAVAVPDLSLSMLAIPGLRTVAFPGLGDVPSENVVAVAILVFVLLMLLLIARSASARRAAAERRRRFHSFEGAAMDDPGEVIGPAAAVAVPFAVEHADDGHGHAEASSAVVEAHAHDEHAPEVHGHEDHGHDDHGHGEHGHDGHDEAHAPAHDEHREPAHADH